jgi:hypothetical protein
LVATALAERARWLPRADSPATLLLLGHAAMALALYVSDGSRDHFAILCVIGCIVAWWRSFLAKPAATEGAQDDRVLYSVGMFLLLIQFARSPGMHVEGSEWLYRFLTALTTLLVASYAADLRGEPRHAGFVALRRLALFLLALATSVWILRASPNPPIDLFPVHQQTAQAILEGKSIYTPGAIEVLDTNHGTFVIRAYTYLPLSAYLTTAAYALTHDVRWANLMAQLVGGVLLWAVARHVAARRNSQNAERDARLPPETWADLVAALFLFHPRGLMVLEKAWTEPLAIPFLGGFALFAVTKRPRAASVCLGLLCAIKQHLVLYVPFLMLVPGVGVPGVALAGLVSLLTMAGYLVRSPMDFYRGAFGNIVSGPFRTDALTLPAELSLLGVVIPTWIGFASALVPLAWLGRVPRDVGVLLLGSCLVFSLFYLCGRQAFLNYYYLLDATALFALATRGAGPAADGP